MTSSDIDNVTLINEVLTYNIPQKWCVKLKIPSIANKFSTRSENAVKIQNMIQ